MRPIRTYAAKAHQVLAEEGLRALVRKTVTHVRGAASEVAPQAVPPQVLFVNGCDASVPHPTRYRVLHQMEQLELVGVSCGERYYLDVLPTDADGADVIVLFRCPLTDAIRQLIDQAHARGKRVYFDVDDLVIDTAYTDDLSVVRSMTPQDKAIFDDGVIRTGKTLDLCDAAIVSTERLATELGRHVGSVLINRNVASQEMVRISEKARGARESHGDDVVLGYFSGSLTHDDDFRGIIPPLVEVLDARPQVKLALTGLSALPVELEPYRDRIIRLPYVDWRELPGTIATVDVNLAPLEDTIFNEAKSENKWLEAALVGVPTIASDVGAFSRMIRQDDTGILCTTQTEWRDSLIRLVDDADYRESIAARALSFCLSHCTTSGTGFRLAHELVGKRCLIQDVLPSGEEGKASLVKDYLDSCGIAVPPRTYDRSPWDTQTLDERIRGLRQARADGKRCAVLLYEMTCGDTASFRYLGYNVACTLDESASWHATFLYVSELAALDDLLDCIDVVVLVRMRVRPDVVSEVVRLHDHGIPVAFAMDDDAVGAGSAPRVIEAMHIDDADEFGHDFWYGVTDRFERMALLADGLIAPLSSLATTLENRYGKSAYVIHSSLNDEQVRISDEVLGQANEYRKGSHPFTVAYFSGTDSHSSDFSLVEGAVLHFLTDHSDARLLLVGCLELSDEMMECYRDGRLILLPLVSYTTLQCLQASVDVVLAPLVIDDFTNCKSALKVFEAGVVETPACASPSFSYAEAIEDGVNGHLCEGEQEWFEALEDLHSDSARCRSMGESARSSSLSNYYGEHIRQEAEQAFDHLLEEGASNHEPCADALLDDLTRQGLDWDDQLVINPPYGRRARHGRDMSGHPKER